MAGVRQTSSGVVQTSSGVAQTELETVIDGFNDGDLSEYTGDTNSFSLTTTPTVDGTAYALEANAGTNEILSSTLAYTPQAGDIFEFWFRSPDGTGAGNNNNRALFYFGWNDTNSDGYRWRWRFETGEFQCRRFDAGSGTLLADDTTVTYSGATWYRCLTEWGSDGSWTVTVDTGSGTSALTTLTFSDSNYTSGEIKWKTAVDSGVDNFIDEAIRTGSA